MRAGTKEAGTLKNLPSLVESGGQLFFNDPFSCVILKLDVNDAQRMHSVTFSMKMVTLTFVSNVLKN